VTNSAPDTAPEDDPVYDCSRQTWYKKPVPPLKDVALDDFRPGSADVVLVTATSTETEYVLKQMEPLPRRRHVLKVAVGYETYYLGRLARVTAALLQCQMGTTRPDAAGYASMAACDRWNPKAMIMVGIAFGRDRARHQPGDVLVAEQVIPYESQRVGTDIVYRSPIPLAGITLLNRFRNLSNWRFLRPDGSRVRIHIGPLLSGEKLIDDPAFKKELTDHFPTAIGGEMEGAGIVAAATRARVEWIVVKAVCDWADGRKHDGYQQLAAAAAASAVATMLSSNTALDGLS
jgi:nucleoside phosphorylase